MTPGASGWAWADAHHGPALPLFNEECARRAYNEWGANCGPGAAAAILGLSLDDARPLFATAGFEGKRYTNPAMMNEVLRASGRPWRKIGARWPNWGLVRVQWEGPWTEAGVPMRARYRYTHWIGAAKAGAAIFDINAMSNGSGWCHAADWERVIVPHLTALYPRATGRWHVTHALDVAVRARLPGEEGLAEIIPRSDS